MAYCSPEQIERAYDAWQPGMTGHNDPTWAEDLDTRPLRRGWSSGYTMGEDAGFTRGWLSCEHYLCNRPWWQRLIWAFNAARHNSTPELTRFKRTTFLLSND